jgi:hypothetical protein
MPVAQLEALGLDVWMLTGDNAATARAIAAEVGIDHVLAEVLPDQKIGEDQRAPAARGGPEGGHSLHRGVGDAKGFYGSYSVLVALAAGIVLIPNAPLGLMTMAVQALAGVLLPSAMVFRLLLCNDRDVLGSWTNPRWLNVVASVIVGVLLLLSLVLVVTTLFPQADPTLVTTGLGLAVTLGLAGLGVLEMRTARRSADPLAGLVLDRNT